MNNIKRVTVIFFALFMSACTTTHYVDEESPISEKHVVIALRDDARNLSEAGAYDQAKAKLERALRIEPGNPILWFELAQLTASTEQLSSAKNLALKAMNLSREPSLQRKIKKFINSL